jgi:multimeric flavodoxin WrbA
MEKKILAIIGSEKKSNESNTVALAGLLIEKISNIYIDATAEIIVLGEQNIRFCKGCMTCTKIGTCCIDDDMRKIVQKMQSADAIILGSPVHISHVSGMYKNFLDRMFVYMHTFEFFGKPFVSIVTTNGSGEEDTLKYMNHTALLLGMIHQGSLVKFNNETLDSEKVDKVAWRIADIFSGEEKLKPTLKNSLYFWSMKKIIRENLSYFEHEHKVWEKRGWYNLSFKEVLNNQISN